MTTNNNNHPALGSLVLPRISTPDGTKLVVEPLRVVVDDSGRVLTRLAWRLSDIPIEEQTAAMLPSVPEINGVEFGFDDFFEIDDGTTRHFIQNWSTSLETDRGLVCFIVNWPGPKDPGVYLVPNQAIEIRRSLSNAVRGALVLRDLGHRISQFDLKPVG